MLTVVSFPTQGGFAVKKKRVTWSQVRTRMKKMSIAGWSSMAKFKPSEVMAHLDAIEQMLSDRRKATAKEILEEGIFLSEPKKKRKPQGK